jgi:hypothetical protein
MSFDAWVVGFGISALLRQLGLVPGRTAFAVLLAVILVDAWLLYRFFSGQGAKSNSSTEEAAIA